MNKIYRPGIVVAVVAVVLYSAGWYYFSKQFEVHVEKQLAAIQTKGFDVSFEKLAIGGWPFGYDITVKNLKIQRGQIFKTWIDGDITFSAKLWKPQEINSLAAGTHHLEFDNFTITGDGFALRSFTFDPMRVRFYYDDLNVNFNENSVLSAKNFEYDIDFTSESSEKGSAEINIRAEDISSPVLKDSPLGETIQNFNIRSVLQGVVEGDTTIQRLTSWFNSDGSLDVKEFGLVWSDLKLNGEGTVSVDQDLQPLAAFTFTVEGFDKTIDAFVAKDYLKANVGDLIKAGTNLFSIGGSKLSLSVQENKLLIGSIPVTEFPKIKWTGNESQ